MFTNRAGSLDTRSPEACKRDYEAEISRHKDKLKVISEFKLAIEAVKDVIGIPHDEQHYFLAQYGDACFEIRDIERRVANLIKHQEEELKKDK